MVTRTAAGSRQIRQLEELKGTESIMKEGHDSATQGLRRGVYTYLFIDELCTFKHYDTLLAGNLSG